MCTVLELISANEKRAAEAEERRIADAKIFQDELKSLKTLTKEIGHKSITLPHTHKGQTTESELVQSMRISQIMVFSQSLQECLEAISKMLWFDKEAASFPIENILEKDM